MRILLKVTFSPETFNDSVRAGTITQKMKRVMEELKPEAAYFTEFDGKRTGLLIVDLPEASQIPTLAEPFFLQFNAQVEFHPVMLPEDLAKANLEALGKKWA